LGRTITKDDNIDSLCCSTSWKTLARSSCDQVAHGLKHCKIYSRKTPGWARTWVKESGNLFNDNNTAITPCETWRSAFQVHLAAERQKKAHGWTIANMGQSELADKQFELSKVM